MKNHITLLFFSLFIGISCSKKETTVNELEGIENYLIGTWIYERETFNSSTSIEDGDTRGVMRYKADETGEWLTDNGPHHTSIIEWDLQGAGERIAITHTFYGVGGIFYSTQIYDIIEYDEDSLTLTFNYKSEKLFASIEPVESFEKITLIRD